MNSSKCIYHRFPKHFFLNLKIIKFYNLELNIPQDTEDYLVYRYGENWNIPDSRFNQSGKWKKSKARVELKMNLLPFPTILEKLLS